MDEKAGDQLRKSDGAEGSLNTQAPEESSKAETAEKNAPASRERFQRSVLEWTETVVMAIVLVAVVFTFCVRIITVEGGSMQPTYHNGDRVLVSSFAGNIERGDVVIVVNALDEPIIKRVVAVAGETVDFDVSSGEVTINGVSLPGAVFGIENGITRVPELPDQVMEFPQKVPEGCVFVLGDNRGNSTDSRFLEVGMVDHRNILGKVIFNVYPFSKIGAVK